MTEALRLPGFADTSATRYFSLGRHALTAGLKMLAIGKGHFVLMPEYICRDLLASVLAVQAEPLFYPVDRSLAPQSLPAAPGVKAVLAVNYFGFPQALEPFRAYCAEQGATLIEDNAHGFLSRDKEGNLLGSRGDLGIASMRKTFALPDGAALLVNRNDWSDRLPAPIPCRADPLPASYLVKRTLRQIQNSTGIRLRSFSEQMTRHLRRIRTGHPLPISLPESELEIPGAAAIHCRSLGMLEEIDPANEVKRRRVLYQDFHRDLRHLDIAPIFGELPPFLAPYGYPFWAGDTGAAAAVRIANRRGFDCFSWPDLPSAVASAAPEFYRNVWWVNFLC